MQSASIAKRIFHSFLFCSAALSCAKTLALKFETEDYNYAKDLSFGNTGGAYRSDDIDRQATPDIGGGFNIGWIEPVSGWHMAILTSTDLATTELKYV